MFFGKNIFLASLVYTLIVKASPSVKSLIFDNSNSSVSIEFSEPIIIENIFLMRKIGDQEDLCVPVSSLSRDIISPEAYNKNVEKLQTLEPESKKYEKLKKILEITRVDVLLSEDVFDNKSSYLFKIITLEEENELYSEEFVLKDNGFEHKVASEGSGWYASPWPWIAIGFIIFSGLLILKIAFC